MIIDGIRISTTQERRHQRRPTQVKKTRSLSEPRTYRSRITSGRCWYDPGWSSVDYLVNATEGSHDRFLAHVLGRASAWAYSDLDSFARAMYCSQRIATEFVSVATTNPALSVHTTAYLAQSHDRRMVIVCFRGTELQNFATWMTSGSTHPDLLLSSGHVHGGFFRATSVLWNAVQTLLYSAQKGHSICDAAMRMKSEFGNCDRHESQRCRDAKSFQIDRPADGPIDLPPAPTSEDPDRLEALYITGHSLGGAMAVLTGALIYESHEFQYLQRKLRGIYTFGQPMVGYRDFAEIFGKRFGHKLFRHLYDHDIVPALPPRTAGHFVHFGEEYTSSDEGWTRQQSNTTRVARTFIGSTIIGLIAMLTRRLPVIPLPRWVKLPFSWDDHDPINYLRSSQKMATGYELF
ncbi:lipase family protein [Sorangium sp. So ce136]|uniref:lipase family protein n=1 Tax=Sorangium sp. So ce136 TaxID=3133284 RepID=UPI003F00C774